MPAMKRFTTARMAAALLLRVPCGRRRREALSTNMTMYRDHPRDAGKGPAVPMWVDKLHRPLGARCRMMGSWCPVPLCRWFISLTLACFSKPRLGGAAVKKQPDSNKGFLPNSISSNTELTGGKGINSSKPPYTASVPETFDALENCELFGTLGRKDSTQLLRGAEIWLARARFVLDLAPTVPGARRVARKYDPLFFRGKDRFST